MEHLLEGNLHSSCIPTILFPTPIARKDIRPYQLSTINARDKQIKIFNRLRHAIRPTESQPWLVATWTRGEKWISNSPHPSCRLRVMPRCIAGPSGESGVGASGRSDALAWAVMPKRGRDQAASGVLGSHVPKGNSGAGVSLDSSSSCRVCQSS